jgi:hypothetical protein
MSFVPHYFLKFYILFDVCSFGEISIIHLCLQWILVFAYKPREGIGSSNR